MTAKNQKLPTKRRDSSNVPTVWTAGDTIKWDVSITDYPASEGWVLSYEVKSATNALATIPAVADGENYTVTILATLSATYTEGSYSYQAYVTKLAERFTVDSGKVSVLKNFGDAGNYDGRSHAKIVVEAIESVIEGRASKDQESYTIAGRSLERTPISDLLVLRDRYRAEVVREDRADRVKRGLGHSGRIKTRFGGVN